MLAVVFDDSPATWLVSLDDAVMVLIRSITAAVHQHTPCTINVYAHTPFQQSLDTIADVPAAVVLLHVSLPLIMEHCRPRNSFKGLLECWIGSIALFVISRVCIPRCRPPNLPFT